MRSLIVLTLSIQVLLCQSQVVLDALPDQTIGREGAFESVSLNDFTLDEVFWEAEFLKPEVTDVRPNWLVNSTDYQFEMNITTSVLSKGVSAIGNSHLLAVVDDAGNVRSVGTGILVQETWMYFLTVYSNINQEELSFIYFDDSLSQIIKGNESFTFASNSVLGEPENPFQVEVGNIGYEINDGVLSFTVEDPTFIGEEKLQVTARSFSDPNDFAEDIITLKIVDDYVPLIAGIPDQVVTFTEQFSVFDLDDFVTIRDSDPVAFSFSGNTQLQVAIDAENSVTITKPSDWSGTEVLTFVVTDQSENGFSSSIDAVFVGKPEDKAPEIILIDDKTTGIGGFFGSINLSDFVVTDNPGAIKWSTEFLTDSIVDAPDWNVNVNEFQFDMTITAKVTSLGKVLNGLNHRLAAFSATENKVVGVTEAIQVDDDWFFFLTINSNSDNDSIYFKVYDDISKRILPTEAHVFFQANNVLGDPIDPYEIEAGYLFPKIKEGQLSFTLRNAVWDGVEILMLTATDTSTTEQLFDRDTINFEVLNLLPPALDGIPNQEIEEGTNFQSIDVANYLNNMAFSEISMTVSGADTLKPSIDGSVISFSIEDGDYFGVEELTIKVISLANADLVDEVNVQLTVNNVNDAPVIVSNPAGSASISALYQYNLLANDVDFDELIITVNDLPGWLYFVSSSSGGVFIGIPTENDAGEHSFNINVSDGKKVVIQSITIIVSSARIAVINGQTIDEGDVFVDVDLDDFLIVNGNVATKWNVLGGTDLDIELNVENVLKVTTPHEDWYGMETLKIQLLDELTDVILDELAIQYEVINVNDLPIFLSNPSLNMDASQQLNVKTLVSDVDNDRVTFSLENAPDWITLFSEIDGFTLFGQPDKLVNTYNFDVIANDGVAESTLAIEISVSVTLSVNESNTDISIFPNPTTDILNIEFRDKVTSIEVLDQSGMTVLYFNKEQKHINVSALNQGVYILLINEKQCSRFIKR